MSLNGSNAKPVLPAGYAIRLRSRCDWGQSGELLYIVMELLSPAKTSLDLLRAKGRRPAGPWPSRDKFLKSLAEAHDQGIVHRDLKPENIFLSQVGDDHDVVKVLDFGIAKMALPQAADATDEKHRSLTISGSTVGTPTYMSPEQAAGEEVDGQTDLYALGIILYEMLDGKPPFSNRDPVRVMRAHLFDEVPQFRDPALRGTVFDRVVRKALAKDKDDRFKTANEFLLAMASDVVAKPLVQGIDLRALDEPSTQEFEAPVDKSGPDSVPNMQTLPFTHAVPRPEDSIPFNNIPAKSPERVRTGSSASSLSDLLPPPGIGDATSSSSIMRILQPPPPEDEVIVLTTKKVDESAERTKAPQTGEQAAQSANPTPATMEAWTWGEQMSVDHEQPRSVTGSHEAASRPKPWAWILLLLLIAAAVGLYLSPFAASLGLR
ncbi:MAG: serine/threonine-protein kinase [bacterium]